MSTIVPENRLRMSTIVPENRVVKEDIDISVCASKKFEVDRFLFTP